MDKHTHNKQYAFHHYVSYAPLMVFVVALAGIMIHYFVWNISILDGGLIQVLGFILVVLSPFLLLWSQRARIKLYDNEKILNFNFPKGPYQFSRHPSYLALVLILLGLAFLLNSMLMLLLVIGFFFFFSLVWIPKEEHMLNHYYPKNYTQYKKKVRMWL